MNSCKNKIIQTPAMRNNRMPTLPRSIVIAITILPHRLAGSAKATAAWTSTTGGIVAGSSSSPEDSGHPGGRAAAADVRIGRRRTSSSFAMSRGDDHNDHLWSTALDGMIDVPGASGLSSSEGVLYLAPAGGGSSRETTAMTASSSSSSSAVVAPPPEWPAIFADNCGMFSLTAHNPMGMTAPPDANHRADEALERDILELVRQNASVVVGSDVSYSGAAARVPPPRAWWRSFGFHEGEGWREDGYTLAFDPEDRDVGRDAVLDLARKYMQAAVYEYAWCGSGGGTLTREVVHVVDPTRNERGEEEEARVGGGGGGGGSRDVMAIVGAPPRSALSGRYRRDGAVGDDGVPDDGV